MQEVNIEEARKQLDRFFAVREPVMMHGPPGIGKTQVAVEMAREKGLPIRILNASQSSPEDFGYYHPKDGVLVHCPPEWFVRASKEPMMVFLDEIQQAPPATMAALCSLVHEGRLGETFLHKDSWLIAASNNLGDQSAANRMPAMLANRFSHLQVRPDADVFINYCQARGLWPMIPAYVKYRPDATHRPPKNAEEYAWTSPRSWEKLSKIVGEGSEKERFEALKEYAPYVVGEGTAHEMVGFCKLSQGIDVMAMLKDPEKARIPAELDMRYSLIGAIHANVRKDPKKLVVPALKLADRFISKVGGREVNDKEYAALLIRALYADVECRNVLTKSKEFDLTWEKYYDVIKQG